MAIGPVISSLVTPDFLISMKHFEKGPSVTIDSSNRDAGNTPTTTIRPGQVLVKRTSTGKFIEADDTNGDRNTAPTTASVEAVDAGWSSVNITYTVNGGAHIFAATDVTTAALVTSLNTDTEFSTLCTASGINGQPLDIATKATGQNVSLILSSSIDAAGVGWGVTVVSDAGSDAEYLVLERFGQLLDESGAAQDDHVPTIAAGHFTRANLTNLTPEAEVVLARAGSKFE